MDALAIAFDGDDTLWESETAFAVTQERLRTLLVPRVAAEVLDARLYATERANLELYGYGAKSFTLSTLETAIELAGDDLAISDVVAILALGKELLSHPVELLPDVEEIVAWAAETAGWTLVVTKGDLFHQESKVALSGLADTFDAVEIVSEKDEATYARILARHGIDPATFVMVGNSLRSDIAPVLAIGGAAVHVPHPLTWAHEHVDDESPLRAHPRFRAIDALRDLPAAIADLRRPLD